MLKQQSVKLATQFARMIHVHTDFHGKREKGAARMNANFRQKLERKKNEKYEHEKIRIFEFGNAFEYSLEIRIFECSNIRSHP